MKQKNGWNLTMKRIIIMLLLALIATSLISFGPASADSPRYLHITEMTMEPQGPHASFTVEYELDFIARLYVLFLGSGNIEPAINNMFYDFDEIKIIILYPKLFHTDISIIAGIDHDGSPSQSIFSIPKMLKK